MKHLLPPSPSTFSRFFGSALILAAALSGASARPVPQNLGNGLDKLVENNLIEQGKITAAPLDWQPVQNTAQKTGRAAVAKLSDNAAARFAAYRTAVAREAGKVDSIALADRSTGKYLVDIMPSGEIALKQLRLQLQAQFTSLDIRNVDTKYAGHGVLEGYVTLDDAAEIAKSAGIGSVILQLRPIHSVGATTSQGINQHRVNRINTLYSNATVNPGGLKYDGTGMSIGVMSDSYNSQPSAEGGFTTAQADVATGDLPGIATATPTAPNTQPVVVLQDYNPTPGATNEGRGMCQIVADMAPMARIGFATADTGEVGFANNIRALGGLSGFTYPAATQQGFKGDVVCDDVSYLDEPMFQDGIVASGVVDVVNAGVTYCSSAANNAGTDGYASVFRPVPKGTGLTAAAGNTSLAGTNINLANVPPAYYAGGFHNFNPNPGQLDVAQTVNTGSDSPFVFQWNDPYDVSSPTLGALIYSTTGSSTGGSSTDYNGSSTPPLPQFTVGQEYVIKETADTSLPAYNFDGIVSVIDPSGNVIVMQDSGTDEVVTFFAPVSGQYTIRVSPFSTASPVGGPAVPTMGPYSLTVNLANGTPRITQDFNLLFFDTSGNFVSALASNNIANNRPIELAASIDSGGAAQVQMVICRSNITTPAVAADHFRYVIFGNGASGVGPDEYFDYLAPVTFGHSAAAGANSVAAYSMFRPNLPEDFTSPGPVTIYFDANNNRLATPQVRLKPDIAAADGANNTFFPLGPAQDVPFDADSSFANFYGTSAASPHAAAIAALVIQAHGGPGHLTPAQVKTLMQLNTFPHDLDPHASGGTATTTSGGTVTVAIASDNSANTSTGSNDPNAWTVSYTGPGYLKEIHFNPEATGATGGNPTGGNYNGGGTGPATEYSDFFNGSNYKYTPGMVFNTNTFAYGNSTGLVSSDAVKTVSNPAPLPSTSAFYWTLNLSFPNNNFTTGKAFRFNVGRNQQQDAQVPQGMTIPSVLYGQTGEYSADILGDGVLIPEYADVPNVLPGMTFNGVISDGTTFSGRITNKIGRGYSPLDGYGFVNAQAATTGTLPTPGVVSRRLHGSNPAQAFDINLPLTGTAGVECRTPDTGNTYHLIYTFDRTISSPGTAVVTQGTASPAPVATVGPQSNQVTVDVAGVSNAQHLIVTLSNVLDTSNNVLASVPARLDVLLGDISGDGFVLSGDFTTVRQQSGVTISQSTFRDDVNCDGFILSGDYTIVRQQSGTSLP